MGGTGRNAPAAAPGRTRVLCGRCTRSSGEEEGEKSPLHDGYLLLVAARSSGKVRWTVCVVSSSSSAVWRGPIMKSSTGAAIVTAQHREHQANRRNGDSRRP